MGAKLKKICGKDILALLMLLLMAIPALINRLRLKMQGRELWVVSEHATARDNGYVFYEYLRQVHPEIDAYYAIAFEGADYEKVKPLGNLVRFGSAKHFLYYMSAKWNVTSHKNGNPNHAVFTLMGKLGFFKNVVFLQHGVLYQDLKMFHKPRCNFRMFCCGAKPEYEFVREYYGYGDEAKYTGLARFDKLHGCAPDDDLILFIPTWRRWLKNRDAFEASEYYHRIMEMLNSPELEEVLERYGKKLCFFPHAGLKMHTGLYSSRNPRVEILDCDATDIQELLQRGSLLVTDYSSIFTDFSYMNKPVVYYQYDRGEFIIKHCDCANPTDYVTYFDFERDGFGPVVGELSDVIRCIEESITKSFALDDVYRRRAAAFFELRDTDNCKRIFEEIRTLG
ncbi:CDP-glycerol glycerophosphotransferase family protein [Paratractidigestivibacter sp.]|uniref:CDP-glycerol glycerophosphotransferase family protein n=1 Tax=Paratractidigestivibacter sp. TaxID=2847316 RepID=UPI002ABD7FFC|nr:CDP-glycerol glycerophosphotransferase family protein [Paratractidigestivibacter sp.]